MGVLAFQRDCALAGASGRTGALSRAPLVIEAKQNAKQRERLSEKQRVYNKARKSAVGTRMKKVCLSHLKLC